MGHPTWRAFNPRARAPAALPEAALLMTLLDSCWLPEVEEKQKTSAEDHGNLCKPLGSCASS